MLAREARIISRFVTIAEHKPNPGVFTLNIVNGYTIST
jgi:hypothetical protein